MADNQEPQKSKRDLVLERLAKRYPDKTWEDDEALMAQIGDDYDEYERSINGYKDNEASMEEMFANDPKNAQFFADMAAGRNPYIAFIENNGLETLTNLMNDPALRAQVDEADRKYAERLANEKKIAEEYDRNMAESQAVCDELEAIHGQENIDAALAVLDNLTKEHLMGKVTREALEMALKIVTHDADIANARTEGELAGRNAKIEEKLRKMKGGDGLPAMGGSGAAPQEKKKSIFDDLPKRKF